MNSPSNSWNNHAAALLAEQLGADSAFVQEVSPWLLGLMRNWLPKGEDYEQMALEVLREAMISLDRFEPGKGSFKTWIGCIGYRRAADFHRRRGRADSGTTGTREQKRQDKFHLTRKLSPESKQQLLQAISSMPPADQELLILYFNDGADDDLVSTIFGITKPTARKRKSRLQKRLLNLAKCLST